MLYLFSLLLTERDHFPVLSHKKLGEVFFIHGDAHFVPILSLRNIQGPVKVHLEYHGSAILGYLCESHCVFLARAVLRRLLLLVPYFEESTQILLNSKLSTLEFLMWCQFLVEIEG